jgi:AcrR family transcriptional regulator
MPYRRTANVEAQLERTRTSILRAARRRIGRTGLHDLSVADVADSADVAVGTIYRYFPTKDALLGEVVDDVCRHEIDLVAEVAVGEQVASTRHCDRLLAAVDCFARRATASGRTAYAVIAEPAPRDIELVRMHHRQALADVFAGVIAEGVDEGEFPPQDASTSATAIVGAVSEVVVGPQTRARRDTDPRRTAASEDVLVDVLAFVRRAVTGVDTSNVTSIRSVARPR